QAFAGLIVPSLFSKRLCSRLNLLQTLCRTPARNDSSADDIGAPIMQPAPCGATHDKLTQRPPFRDGIRAFATRATLCLSPPSHGSKCSCRPSYSPVPTRDLLQFASLASPPGVSLAAASSSLRYSVERPIFNRRATSDICP